VASEEMLSDAIAALGRRDLPPARLPVARSAGALVYASPAVSGTLRLEEIP
jgi:hypothetical protein